jgi:hypothetical protein
MKKRTKQAIIYLCVMIAAGIAAGIILSWIL